MESARLFLIPQKWPVLMQSQSPAICRQLLQNQVSYQFFKICQPGLLRAVALRCSSGAAFTVAVAPLIIVEKNGDGSAIIFGRIFFAASYDIYMPYVRASNLMIHDSTS
jgi:hypothetical protein